jgi:hypothetical protein
MELAVALIWMDPSFQLMHIYLTHYFLGDFREGNMVINAELPTSPKRKKRLLRTILRGDGSQPVP